MPRASSFRSYKDALLVPVHKSYGTPRGTRACGVFDFENQPIDGVDLATSRWRSYPTPDFALSARREAVGLPGAWLFGGLLRPHFGHMLTNALGRLWAVEETGADGIVFIGDKAKEPVFSAFEDLIKALGLALPHQIARRSTVVDNLLIAEDLFSEARAGHPDPCFVEWIRTRLRTSDAPSRKLYITRSRLDPLLGRALNEDILEANFAQRGYEIIAPEHLSIADQIALYREASQIVCTDSSALHLIALAASAEAQVGIILRRDSLPELLTNQLMGFGQRVTVIDAVKTLWWREERADNRALADLDFVKLRDDLRVAGLIRPGGPWRAPTAHETQSSLQAGSPPGTRFMSTEEHGAFLEDQRRARKAAAMPDATTFAPPPAIDGLRYLRLLGRMHTVLKPRWYLEVGTFTGKSLSKVNCNFIAVDPKFQLSTPIDAPGAAQMHLFQQTSDAFFASRFAERNEITFDLAFLDGLHHFEVLLRDFINTERLMTPSGVITLHDCCPSTVDMTNRTQGPGNWTGDVWKTLLILLDHRPDLEVLVTRAAPTGLVIVRGLNPKSTTLAEAFDDEVAKYADMSISDLEGGLSGFYEKFELIEPEKALAILNR